MLGGSPSSDGGSRTRYPALAQWKILAVSSHTSVSGPSLGLDYNTSPPELLCIHLGSRHPSAIITMPITHTAHVEVGRKGHRAGMGAGLPSWGRGSFWRHSVSPWPAIAWRVPRQAAAAGDKATALGGAGHEGSAKAGPASFWTQTVSVCQAQTQLLPPVSQV